MASHWETSAVPSYASCSSEAGALKTPRIINVDEASRRIATKAANAGLKSKSLGSAPVRAPRTFGVPWKGRIGQRPPATAFWVP